MNNWKSDEPCVCCGHCVDNEQTYHHPKTRKAYPEFQDKKWNQISCCLMHHNEFHNSKLSEMAKKYKGVMDFLIKHNWNYLEQFSKWMHPSEEG